MALAQSVCVDRYEAHLVEVRSDGSSAPHPHFARPEEGKDYRAVSSAGVKPQGYISAEEAEAACGAAGKRLCTASEWYRACRGPENTTYPYGNRFDRDKCNVGKKHILSQLHGSNPSRWTYAAFNDPQLNQQSALAPAGQHADCTNGYGLYDMVGNLHEWVGDRVDRTLPKKLKLARGIARSVRKSMGNGVFLGGFFSTVSEHGDGCQFATLAHGPRYHDYSTGFRCCADPK